MFTSKHPEFALPSNAPRRAGEPMIKAGHAKTGAGSSPNRQPTEANKRFEGPVSGFVGGGTLPHQHSSGTTAPCAPIINATPSLIASQPVVLGSCLRPDRPSRARLLLVRTWRQCILVHVSTPCSAFSASAWAPRGRATNKAASFAPASKPNHAPSPSANFAQNRTISRTRPVVAASGAWVSSTFALQQARLAQKLALIFLGLASGPNEPAHGEPKAKGNPCDQIQRRKR
ncbi:hypothetical protein MAPG_01362 [Magnaporthiopsis poae ATCC 64411]|uniref:Uncharacterized protein n=1 Tax=Magnaporthiopsis poae (strain ATCC 64411 / 73-15) TaxID=644358 RepID=A0A0C4DNH8_MAGP6|nr:hypothetical protein MAPG_01362 [Magnaporthiopsis poae ATCC 64411]